jgi:hypothetical protein
MGKAAIKTPKPPSDIARLLPQIIADILFVLSFHKIQSQISN